MQLVVLALAGVVVQSKQAWSLDSLVDLVSPDRDAIESVFLLLDACACRMDILSSNSFRE